MTIIMRNNGKILCDVNSCQVSLDSAQVDASLEEDVAGVTKTRPPRVADNLNTLNMKH